MIVALGLSVVATAGIAFAFGVVGIMSVAEYQADLDNLR